MLSQAKTSTIRLWHRTVLMHSLFAAGFIVGPMAMGSEPPLNEEKADLDSQRRASGEPMISSKIIRYAEHLMSQYDLDHDGQLQQREWKTMRGHPELIDQDGDQIISLDEVIRWNAEYGRRRQIGISLVVASPTEALPLPQTDPAPDEKSGTRTRADANQSKGDHSRNHKFFVPPRRLPTGLPDWFLARDQDGDAQLTLGEFSPSGATADTTEFASYDANGDGVITAKECVTRQFDTSARTAKSNRRRAVTD